MPPVYNRRIVTIDLAETALCRRACADHCLFVQAPVHGLLFLIRRVPTSEGRLRLAAIYGVRDSCTALDIWISSVVETVRSHRNDSGTRVPHSIEVKLNAAKVPETSPSGSRLAAQMGRLTSKKGKLFNAPFALRRG